MNLKQRPDRQHSYFLMAIIRHRAWVGWRWYWRGRTVR